MDTPSTEINLNLKVFILLPTRGYCFDRVEFPLGQSLEIHAMVESIQFRGKQILPFKSVSLGKTNP